MEAQQTVVDTYSSVTFTKVYTAKIPVTAAEHYCLNERFIIQRNDERKDIRIGVINDVNYFGERNDEDN